MSRIITFYSYKGGVGRTFALANIAVLLAKRGKRVLMMDWDLEAPGLERYFSPFIRSENDVAQGTIHLLTEAISNPQADWRQHVQSVNVGETQSLHIIPSGAQHETYISQVQKFEWTNFYDQYDGGPILDRWRAEWKDEYDFILLDSRTGVTDTGGVCTILLPDFLVLVCTTNEQNFSGALAVVLAAQQGRRYLDVQRPPLTILPLLGRFDGREELDEAQTWLNKFADTFKPFYDDWLPTRFNARSIIELTKIPYVARFTFGEPLAVLTHSITDPDGPGFYLENCSRLLASDFTDAEKIIAPTAPEELTIIDEISNLISDFTSRKATADELSLLITQAEMELGNTQELVDSLVSVGQAFMFRAEYDKAESCFRKALNISENLNGPHNINSATPLNELAILLLQINRWREAEPLIRRALEIDEKNLGSEHPNVAIRLNNLASLLQDTNRLQEAEPLMRHALEINEKSFGSEHPNVATGLNNLASLLQDTNRGQEAEPLMRRALEIDEKTLGSEHPNVAIRLNNLALLLHDTNRLQEAEPLMRRALKINEKSFGPEHPKVATGLSNLALLLQATNRLQEAEPLMRRALEIDEKNLGPEHPEVATDLNNLAQLLQATNRLQEAEPLTRRALKIDEKSYGPDHPNVAIELNNLAQLLHDTNRLQEAEPLMRRALEITEKSFGPEHPKVATELNNLALLLKNTNRLQEAEPLMRRALEIDEKSYGPKHPEVATDLNNLAQLLKNTNRLQEAEPLMGRSLLILASFMHSTGHEHPNFKVVEHSYRRLLEHLKVPTEEINTRIKNMVDN